MARNKIDDIVQWIKLYQDKNREELISLVTSLSTFDVYTNETLHYILYCRKNIYVKNI